MDQCISRFKINLFDLMKCYTFQLFNSAIRPYINFISHYLCDENARHLTYKQTVLDLPTPLNHSFMNHDTPANVASAWWGRLQIPWCRILAWSSASIMMLWAVRRISGMVLFNSTVNTDWFPKINSARRGTTCCNGGRYRQALLQRSDIIRLMLRTGPRKGCHS